METSRGPLIFGIIVAIVVGATVLQGARQVKEARPFIEAEQRREEEAARQAEARRLAYAAFQEVVTERLKCPATAIFPPQPDSMTFSEIGGRCVGYVDSQNGFGALVRTRYTADLLKDGGVWKCAVEFIDRN